MKYISGKKNIIQWLNNLENDDCQIRQQEENKNELEKYNKYREECITQCAEFKKYLQSDEQPEMYEESDDESDESDDDQSDDESSNSQD